MKLSFHDRSVGAQTPIVLMCTERGGCALLSRYYIAITSPDRRNTGRYLCPQHKQLLLRKFTGFTSAETHHGIIGCGDRW